MKHFIYTVYDLKAEMWNKPLIGQGDKVGLMVRTFTDLANDKQHPIGQHPEDYCLFRVGEWDDDEGKLIITEPPVSLGKAINYVKKNDLPNVIKKSTD